MASMVLGIITSSFFFFFVIICCMHFSDARHLPPAAAIISHVKLKPPPSSSSKPLPSPISLQDSEKRAENGPPAAATPVLKGESLLTTGGIIINAQDIHKKKKKIDAGVGAGAGRFLKKAGSEIVESSSSSHHVALLKGKHVEDPEVDHSLVPHDKYYSYVKEDAIDDFKKRNDGDNEVVVVVMDYQPPHRKTPIHNK